MMDIATVPAALTAGDLDGALGALLVIWTETRASEIAELIGEVSARATSQRPAVPRAPRKEAQAAWLARVRAYRPGDLGDLLAALVELLAVGPSRFPIPLMDELLAVPPDPRIAEAMLEALAGPIGGWEGKTYIRIVKLLVRHGDARLDARFATAVAQRKKNFLQDDDATRLAKVPVAWAKQPRAVAPGAGLATVRAALATAPSVAPVAAARVKSSAILLAEIYADPTDLATRQVYADVLSAAGDPRGELIALQLARAEGRSTPASLARETALLAKHRTAWLGPLAQELVIADTVWERGFPVATKTKLAKVHQAEASLVRPEWATFERITFGGAALITETMRALEEVHALTVAGALRLGKLAAPPPRLRAIGLDIEYADKPLASHPAIRAVLAVPTLRTLAVHVRWEDMTPAQLVELCATAGERLEQLVLTGGYFWSSQAIAPALAESAAHGLRAFGWGVSPALHAIARRDRGSAWTTLEVVCGAKLVPPTWRKLAETLVTGLADQRFETVTVMGDAAPADRAEVAAVVARVAKRCEVDAAAV